eukprot:175250_1
MSLLRFTKVVPRLFSRSTQWNSAVRFQSAIPISLVKELRMQTDAPISDCKKALEATASDLKEAHIWLRKKGIAAANKLAGRTAKHGLVGAAVAHDGSRGSLIEVNSETDFVARNEKFCSLVSHVTETALEAGPLSDLVSELPDLCIPGTKITVADSIRSAVTVMRENIKLRRGTTLDAPSPHGHVSSYVHQAVSVGVRMGQKAALVAIDSDAKATRSDLERVGKLIAMHVVASSPRYLQRSDVPQSVIEQEEALLRERAVQSGKPENVVDKVVTGQLRKFYADCVLLEQSYIHDDRGRETVEKALVRESKACGVRLTLTDFRVFNIGEEF